MKPAVELADVSKVYRKYAYRRQFATLKSAFLKGSLASALSPEETFSAVNHVSLRITAGSAFGIVMTGRNVGVLVGPILLPPVLLAMGAGQGIGPVCGSITLAAALAAMVLGVMLARR